MCRMWQLLKNITFAFSFPERRATVRESSARLPRGQVRTNLELDVRPENMCAATDCIHQVTKHPVTSLTKSRVVLTFPRESLILLWTLRLAQCRGPTTCLLVNRTFCCRTRVHDTRHKQANWQHLCGRPKSSTEEDWWRRSGMQISMKRTSLVCSIVTLSRYSVFLDDIFTVSQRTSRYDDKVFKAFVTLWQKPSTTHKDTSLKLCELVEICVGF